jgi:tetratricopeptide (TPR) repeat protein
LRANYYFSNANHNFSEGKYRLAIEEYERALSHNPNLSTAYQFLGESYKNLYKPAVETEENKEIANKALDALNKAYEIDPNNKDIINSLGDMYDKMRDFEEAEKYYLKVLDLEPANMANYYVVAGFYKRYAGSTDEEEEGEETDEVAQGPTPFQRAQEMYLRRIELDPESAQGYAYIAQFYSDITPIPDFDKAFFYHSLQTDLDPENAITYYAIGVNRFSKAYRLQNQLSRAERIALGRQSEEALTRAIQIDSSYPDSYAYLNILYRNVWANVYPENRSNYIAEADRWGEQFQEVRRRASERKRLEDELTKGEIR